MRIAEREVQAMGAPDVAEMDEGRAAKRRRVADCNSGGTGWGAPPTLAQVTAQAPPPVAAPAPLDARSFLSHMFHRQATGATGAAVTGAASATLPRKRKNRWEEDVPVDGATAPPEAPVGPPTTAATAPPEAPVGPPTTAATAPPEAPVAPPATTPPEAEAPVSMPTTAGLTPPRGSPLATDCQRWVPGTLPESVARGLTRRRALPYVLQDELQSDATLIVLSFADVGDRRVALEYLLGRALQRPIVVVDVPGVTRQQGLRTHLNNLTDGTRLTRSPTGGAVGAPATLALDKQTPPQVVLENLTEERWPEVQTYTRELQAHVKHAATASHRRMVLQRRLIVVVDNAFDSHQRWLWQLRQEAQRAGARRQAYTMFPLKPADVLWALHQTAMLWGLPERVEYLRHLRDTCHGNVLQGVNRLYTDVVVSAAHQAFQRVTSAARADTVDVADVGAACLICPRVYQPVDLPPPQDVEQYAHLIYPHVAGDVTRRLGFAPPRGNADMATAWWKGQGASPACVRAQQMSLEVLSELADTLATLEEWDASAGVRRGTVRDMRTDVLRSMGPVALDKAGAPLMTAAQQAQMEPDQVAAHMRRAALWRDAADVRRVRGAYYDGLREIGARNAQAREILVRRQQACDVQADVRRCTAHALVAQWRWGPLRRVLGAPTTAVGSLWAALGALQRVDDVADALYTPCREAEEQLVALLTPALPVSATMVTALSSRSARAAAPTGRRVAVERAHAYAGRAEWFVEPTGPYTPLHASVRLDWARELRVWVALGFLAAAPAATPPPWHAHRAYPVGSVVGDEAGQLFAAVAAHWAGPAWAADVAQGRWVRVETPEQRRRANPLSFAAQRLAPVPPVTTAVGVAHWLSAGFVRYSLLDHPVWGYVMHLFHNYVHALLPQGVVAASSSVVGADAEVTVTTASRTATAAAPGATTAPSAGEPTAAERWAQVADRFVLLQRRALEGLGRVDAVHRKHVLAKMRQRQRADRVDLARAPLDYLRVGAEALAGYMAA